MITFGPSEIGLLFATAIFLSGFLGYVMGLKDERIRQLEERTKTK